MTWFGGFLEVKETTWHWTDWLVWTRYASLLWSGDTHGPESPLTMASETENWYWIGILLPEFKQSILLKYAVTVCAHLPLYCLFTNVRFSPEPECVIRSSEPFVARSGWIQIVEITRIKGIQLFNKGINKIQPFAKYSVKLQFIKDQYWPSNSKSC